MTSIVSLQKKYIIGENTIVNQCIKYFRSRFYETISRRELCKAGLVSTKHINTCSSAPWHAVIEPRRMAVVGVFSPM